MRSARPLALAPRNLESKIFRCESVYGEGFKGEFLLWSRLLRRGSKFESITSRVETTLAWSGYIFESQVSTLDRNRNSEDFSALFKQLRPTAFENAEVIYTSRADTKMTMLIHLSPAYMRFFPHKAKAITGQYEANEARIPIFPRVGVIGKFMGWIYESGNDFFSWIPYHIGNYLFSFCFWDLLDFLSGYLCSGEFHAKFPLLYSQSARENVVRCGNRSNKIVQLGRATLLRCKLKCKCCFITTLFFFCCATLLHEIEALSTLCNKNLLRATWYSEQHSLCNFQRSNVARRVVRFCCSYYRTLWDSTGNC